MKTTAIKASWPKIENPCEEDADIFNDWEKLATLVGSYAAQGPFANSIYLPEAVRALASEMIPPMFQWTIQVSKDTITLVLLGYEPNSEEVLTPEQHAQLEKEILILGLGGEEPCRTH